MKYAAFIICFERPRALIRYIDILRAQSSPPEYILIVDNSLDDSVEKLNLNKKFPEVNYFKIGYNSGPAGGAKHGLRRLKELNYKWVFWGDDDNPPRDNQVCADLFACIEKLEKQNVPLGIIGGKGGMFNKWIGKIQSLSNKQLIKKDIVEVDVVPGGHSLLVNTDYLLEKTYPEEKLFFGFEELDICLKFKKQGARIFVDAKSWYKKRQLDGNAKESYRFKINKNKKARDLKREYLSSRNLLFILNHNKYFLAIVINILKIIFKSIISFRYGLKHGRKFVFYQYKAIFDFLRGDYSFNVPLKK